MLHTILRRVVITGIFSLIFIPFIIFDNLFFPFIAGKNFAFRLIVEIIAAAWFALAIVDPTYRPRKSLLVGAFALFIAIIGLADILGENPFKSFWSNFERMEGWVTLVHLFVLLVVATSTLTTEKLWRRFWITSVAASILMGFIGLLQLSGNFALTQSSVARIDGTFGNATYLAAYMLFHFFIALWLWVSGALSIGNKIVTTVIAVAILVLQSAAVFFTGTRGSMLGLLAGFLLAGVLLLVQDFFAKEPMFSRTMKRAFLGVVAALVVLAGAFFVVKDQAWVRSVPSLERLASISLEDNTIKARFMNWGMAWEGFKERPLLGWGQENYNFVFNKYYNPQMYAQEPWFDRVHNIFFDWLIAGGILGLLSYLSLFGISLWYLWRTGAFTAVERAILTGLLAAYGFHNLFVFDNITSYLMFIFVLAFLASRVNAWKGGKVIWATLPSLSVRALPVVGAVAILSLWGVAYAVNADMLAANRALLKGISPHAGGVEVNRTYFEQAIGYGTSGTQEAREQLAQFASALETRTNVTTEERTRIVTYAAQELDKQVVAVPGDARFPFFLGILLDGYSQYDSAAPYLERARVLSPNKQVIRFEYGANLINRGQTEAALALLKETYELAPEYNDALAFYAMAAIRSGQTELADQLVTELGSRGVYADPRVIAAYASREMYPQIISLWEMHLQQRPGDVQGWFSLAAAYYRSGNTARAIEILKDTARSFPGIANQANTFIQQLQSGTVPAQ